MRLDVLGDVVREGVALRVHDGQLQFRGPRGALGESLSAELAGNKSAICAFIGHGGRIAPASFAQRRLWVLDRFFDLGPAYTIPIPLRIRGNLDAAALRTAVAAVIQRHESLRTCFLAQGGEPMQHVQGEAALSFETVDLHDVPAAELQRESDRAMRVALRRPFDLTRCPLIRFLLVYLRENEHLLLITAHHSIFDGWSVGVLLSDIAFAYSDSTADRPPRFFEPPAQYAEYAMWQRQYLAGEPLAQRLDFWKNLLYGAPPLLNLPLDKPRPRVQTYRGRSHRFALPARLADAARRLAQGENATLFMVLYASFTALLYRYTGEEDLVVGVPVAERARPEVKSLIGLVVNTLPIRTRVKGEMSFRELLNGVRRVVADCLSNQDLPLELLLEELQVERDPSYAPLFQVMFVLQNMPRPALRFSGLTLSRIDFDHQVSKLDLSLSVSEENDALECWLEYNRDLFDEETISAMANHWRRLLEHALEEPDRPVSELDLLTQQEYHQQFTVWNATGAAVPDTYIHERIDAQSERTPEAPALIFDGGSMSYGELRRLSNRLARHLRLRGLGPEQRVAVDLPRGPDLVVTLLAIMKAGGAYVPLEPMQPVERRRQIVVDCKPAMILAGDAGEDENGVARLDVRDLLQQAAEGEDDAPDAGLSPDSLAYVIYTSGSAGSPKGVLIEHRSVTNVLESFVRSYEVGPGDAVLQQTSPAFDVSVNEIFAILTVGGRLVISPDALQTDLDRLSECVTANRVTILGAVPSLLRHLNRHSTGFPTLRLVLSGGESLKFSDVDVLARTVTVVNGYGPTEATVCATCHVLPQSVEPSEETVPIGRPLTNYRLYVLGPRLEPMPVGCAGELCIGGVGVARGYLNNNYLSRRRFVRLPFLPQERVYRSGDRVRYRRDGTLEFLGRLDTQVKIRGYRVEPGEVEAALLSDPAVREAVVVARESPDGTSQLVAYIVPSDGKANEHELRQRLRQKLPFYMVPANYVSLDRLPLSPTGKLDRAALPAVSAAEAASVEEREGGDVETVLARIWCGVLGRNVSNSDDFFASGGDSLSVLVVAERARQEGLCLAPIDLYSHPRLTDLAESCRRRSQAEAAPRANAMPRANGHTETLVPIKPTGSRPPFFCVAPAGGIAFPFYNLAPYLDDEQPFYGLQDPSLNQGWPMFDSVGDLSRHYLSEMRKAQRQGPYYLGGWSFGAVVAFDMAQQLVEEGEEVAMLAVMDAQLPRPHESVAGVARRLRKTCSDALLLLRVSRHCIPYLRDGLYLILPSSRRVQDSASDGLTLGDYLSWAWRDAVWQSLFRNAEVKGAVSRNPDLLMLRQPGVRRVMRVLSANIRATRRYSARPYRGTIDLFRTATQLGAFRADDDGTLGWQRVAQSVRVHPIPGNHVVLLRKPYVETFGRLLTARLRELQQPGVAANGWDAADSAATPASRVNVNGHL